MKHEFAPRAVLYFDLISGFLACTLCNYCPLQIDIVLDHIMVLLKKQKH